jgi:hypothetical protein
MHTIRVDADVNGFLFPEACRPRQGVKRGGAAAHLALTSRHLWSGQIAELATRLAIAILCIGSRAAALASA